MAKGTALTIGLNAVDPKHYQGWSGELNACEADAQDMADIGKSQGFKVKTLLTKQATRGRVAGEISKAAASLKSGDIFMLSYSGHGGQVPDPHGDEPDSEDETWCLFDGELIDDEIYLLLGKFAPGVRVLAFSDSCHSGTVLKQAYYQGTTAARSPDVGTQKAKYRFMPASVALRTYRNNKKFYDTILKNPKLKGAQEAVKASALLISGCQDNQLSSDGDFNGLFTGMLLQVWNHGMFKGKTYKIFYRDILRRMPPDQTPNYFRVGKTDPKFEKQKPFTV